MSTLQKLMKRSTSGPEGGGEIRPRRFKFTIDPGVCERGMFDADFTLVLQSPSAADEIKATKRCEQDPVLLTKELAKISIVEIDGEPVKDGDLSRDAVWEALGIGGRALVTKTFLECVSPGADAEGKTRASLATLA